MVWNYYFISARWLPPLRIKKVKVKVKYNLENVKSRLNYNRVILSSFHRFFFSAMARR